jgi:glutaredoxin
MDKAVKLYALSTCGHCKCAKKLLEECGIVYDCTEVDKLPKDELPEVLEEVKKLNARCSFPTMVIGDQVIVGYKEAEIKKALGI